MILLAAGGTGGHVYPALALAEELRTAGFDVRWSGRPDSLEARLAAQAGFDFEPLAAAGFFGKQVREKVKGAGLAAVGLFRALALLRRLRPTAVVGTGGFASATVLAAAALSGVTYFLLEQNCVPGRVTRIFARGARESFFGFPPAEGFKGRWRVTGSPLRRSIVADPRRIDDDRTVLVLGGSGGARALSTAALAAAAALPDVNFIVLAGRRDFAAFRSQAGKNCEVVEYTDRPEELYRRATIAVSRAGGMVLSELVAFGIPAVLVPFPYATDRHQHANAAYLVAAGAAIKLDQDRLSGITAVIAELLADRARRELMAAAARGLARPDAARVIVERIKECLAA